MNSLDWRYEATKIVRELAGYADCGLDEESVFALIDLARKARELMKEAK